MRKLLKQFIFVIPIFIVLIVFSSVKAAPVCDTTNGRQSTTRKVRIDKTNITFSVPGVHNAAFFYLFSLDGVPALCLDAGKPLQSVEFYLQSNSPVTDINIKKAYLYAKNNQGDIGKRLVAQIVTWAARKNYTVFDLSVLQGFQNYAAKYRGVSENDALVYLNELLSLDVSSLDLYIWERPGSNMQNLVSEYGTSSGDTPCNSRCRMETIDELAICSGTSPVNSGTVYQQPVGECATDYTEDQFNYYGEFEKKFGKYCRMYCKESIVEEFPGNIATAVNTGRYIVWPNSNEGNNSLKNKANLPTYPLKLIFKKTCKILVNDNLLGNVKDDYRGFKNTMWSLRNYANEAINNSCGKYQEDVTEKERIYNEKKAELDKCKSDNNGNGIIYVPNNPNQTQPCFNYASAFCHAIDACQGFQASTDSANKELEDARKELNNCNDYKTAYDGAKGVLADFNGCINATTTNDYKYVSINLASSYNDPKYSGNFDLKESGAGVGCENCTSSIGSLDGDPRNVEVNQFDSKISLIEQRDIAMATTKSYDLNDGYYYYVNKKNNDSVHSNAGLANYSTIGFSNMPISYQAKSNTLYNLEIKMNISGTAFDAELNSQNYVCHYKVKDAPDNPGSCNCPDGTEGEGTNLDCLIKDYNEKNTEKITCADGQVLFCNSNISEQEAKCDPITCPNDPSMDLSACINDGKSYNECADLWCNNPDIHNKKPVCPAGTNEGMDLTSCVFPMVNKGMSYEEALNYCVDTTCPGGIRIIWRKISLSDPFPSFNADRTVTQKNLSIGMFNDNVKGRYPGSNWNSTKVVKNEILNNRNVDGDEVYNKTPLYTFVLDSKQIKEIRAYNKKLGDKYSDFNLSCVVNRSRGCVSDFVHNSSLSGLITNTSKSTCGGKLTTNNFYTCEN